jgi:hypothetical protein
VVISLDPKTEARLRAIAASRRLPIETCLARIVENEAITESAVTDERAQESLVDFFRRSPLWGANLDLGRPQDFPREVDLK